MSGSVDLLPGAFYWIKGAYANDPNEWVIARWEHGCWWDCNGKEATPCAISGPISPPSSGPPP